MSNQQENTMMFIAKILCILIIIVAVRNTFFRSGSSGSLTNNLNVQLGVNNTNAVNSTLSETEVVNYIPRCPTCNLPWYWATNYGQ
jgi:hypothetical protein